MTKKVLLTGASGFIGYQCIEPLLHRGYEVHAVTARSWPDTADGVTWHQADLLVDSKALIESINPTHLVHLAWNVVPGKYASSPDNFAWVAATMELLKWFGGERAVLAGSSFEYDWTYGYCSEKLTPRVPDSVYGSCKDALYSLGSRMAELKGFSLAWGRVFFLYGPREHPDRLVSSVIRSLLKNEPAMCSHGRQVRDYLHVQDVANGFVAALESSVEGAVNICSGNATTIREIVVTIGQILDKPDLIQLGALPARPNDVPLVVGDNRRLVSETDWKQKFELAAGLQQTIEWWKQAL